MLLDFFPRRKCSSKLKLHFKILLVFGFSLRLLPVGVTSSPIDNSTALNVTSFMGISREVLSTQGPGSKYSSDDIQPVIIATSTHKLEENSTHSSSRKRKPLKGMSILVAKLIAEIRDFTKTTSDETAYSSQHNDKLQNLSNIPPKPKTTSPSLGKHSTSESISDESLASIRKSSTDFLSRRVTPVLQYENDTDSSLEKYYKDGKVASLNEFKFKNFSTNLKFVENNTTPPTELHEYYSEPVITMSMDDFLYELNKKKSHLGFNSQDISSSSEITTPLSEILFLESLDDKNVTIENAGSSTDRDIYTVKELSTSKGQNEGNMDLFLLRRQDKSASIDNRQGENFLPTSVSPVLLSNKSSEFSDLPVNNPTNYGITVSISENEASNNSDFKSEISTETVSTLFVNHQTPYQNLSELADSDILIENRTVILEEGRDYVVIVPRICSNFSVVNRLLYLLNSSPNSKKISNFTCENMKNIQLPIKSKELMGKINKFLKAETKTDDIVVIKILSNSTMDIEIFSQSWYEVILHPKVIIILIGNSVLVMCVTLICVAAFKKKCRQHSTSHDLHHIPHVNSNNDYNLAPIPRPSIYFPNGNRDCLHSYANVSGTIEDHSYEDVEKEVSAKQEMQNFTMFSRRKMEFKPSKSQDSTSYTRDRLQEKNSSEKYGVDNPGCRK